MSVSENKTQSVCVCVMEIDSEFRFHLNIRYADDSVLIKDKEQEIQNLVNFVVLL